MIWYKETAEDLYRILKSSKSGLTDQEAQKRLKEYGPNQLAIHKTPLWRIIIEPFNNIFIYVLLLAAVVSLLSHEILDAIIVSIVILINSIIFYTQQYATSRVLRSLKKHSIQTVTVLRNKIKKITPSTNLVPGDIITISEGERIPADARVIHTDSLEVDEASLTGESNSVHKHASTLGSNKELYEQDNMVFQGTYVISGSAQCMVVNTGGFTEFGKIAKLASNELSKSPVQSKIDNLISILVRIIAVLALIVFVLSLLRGIPIAEAIRFVLSLSVSAVPEGLPVVLTVIIVLGMRRLAKQEALVQSFKAIEDIGLVTAIATDKTGTLTKNHLSVADHWSIGSAKVEDIAPFTLNLNDHLTDPLDIAISEQYNLPPTSPSKTYPFDLKLRMSGVYVIRDKTIYIKGSPEHLLVLSNLSSQDRHKAESKMHELASQGYRVIAFCKYISEQELENLAVLSKENLYFIGFLAFADELRDEAGAAIDAAQKAGISVRLITGDHYETAFNIGKRLGLITREDQLMKGSDMPQDIDMLTSAISNKTIFARILPENKFMILKALKKSEITAMTGDGVNDVPAISNAHIGIAMGSGSDIAKDASDIILLNDNFATIIKAISEGRKIYDNIRRMLFYLLSTSLGEVLTMIGALFMGLPLPVTAIQILWINLVTDTVMVLPLGLEPAEDGHMSKPPRNPKEPLLSKMLIKRMILVAVTMATIIMIIAVILREHGYTEGEIRTVSFMTLIAAQWMNAFNARSEFKSSFSRIKKLNKGLIVGLFVAVSLQCLVMFTGFGKEFGIEKVPYEVLVLSSLIMMASVLAIVEVQKYIYSLTLRKH